MELNHFLITRFNLKKKEWHRDKNQKEVLDEVWLEKRIELFNKFCLPSVLSQTTTNFEWLIFFEKESRKNIDQLIDRLSQYPFITPIFVDGYEKFQENLPTLISERSRGNLIITTRLDNDDALHRDFIQGVQRATNTLKTFPAILSYPNGLFLDLGFPPRLGELCYPKNQFLTLAERNFHGLPKTVYGEEHHKWNNLPCIVINNNYSWLQISHEDNQENYFKGWLAFKRKLKGFGVSPVDFSPLYDLHVAFLQLKKKLYVELPGRYFVKANFKKLKKKFQL